MRNNIQEGRETILQKLELRWNDEPHLLNLLIIINEA